MRNEVRLFINDEELELSDDLKILLNYKQTDMTNPVVVRNSFTKSITVDGTNRNNDIFGHIWNLDRYQLTGMFNPIQKAPFQLFVNGELFQKGYVKLDSVEMSNNTLKFSITLFGGLGSFFFNLSYEDGSSTKKNLASLTYSETYLPEPDLDFTINIDSVHDAWGKITHVGSSTDEKWNVINFAPCYNGRPDNFSSDKVLINNNNISYFQKSLTEEGTLYRPVLNGSFDLNGYSLGTLPEEMTEWQTFDLRSYNQRPVLRIMKLIQACCQPENNGGFEVKLSNHFFNTENPYYWDAWMTLPMLKDLDGVGGGETYEVSGATIEHDEGAYYNVDFNSPIASIDNVSLDLRVSFTPENATSATELYSHRDYYSRTNLTLQGSKFVKTFEYNTGVVVQLLAYDNSNSVVGQSKAYLLSGGKYYPGTNNCLYEQFYDGDGIEPEYAYINGYWRKIDGEYVFCDENGNETLINFNLNAPSDFARLVFKIKTPEGHYITYAFSGKERDINYNSSSICLYTSPTYNTTGNHTKAEAISQDRVMGEFGFEIENFDATVTDYGALFSGTKITKEKLLAGDKTPADYLLSYCKMFGLYFYFDSTEESDNPEKYPLGVVHIMDRDTFYNEEDIVDLSELIDYSKKLTITPSISNSKWYSFDQEQVESEVAKIYKEEYGKNYGQQLINTNYNFNNDTVELYDGNAFKAGIMSREKDKYFKRPSQVPNYVFNGMKYSLFANGEDGYEEFEITIPAGSTDSWSNINEYGLDYYDCFPKLECHGDDNSPSDGRDVLLFLNYSVSTSGFNYWLTDDVAEMAYLNEGEPCWIYTGDAYDGDGNRIAYPISILPFFTRDLTLWGQEGTFAHSWNFGHPQITFVPNTYTVESDSIYDKCWKNYISDLYDENTRKLSCYVKVEFDGRPWPYWLRRFYWFQNSIWVLNEITDMNIGSFDVTKMEFIKVQDVDDYKVEQIKKGGSFEIELSTYNLPCSGGIITGTVRIASSGGWFASDNFKSTDENGVSYYYASEDIITPHSSRGGVTTFTLDIPANDKGSQLTWEISMEDDFDEWHKVYFTQDACPIPKIFAFSPATANVTSGSGTQSTTLQVSGYDFVSWSGLRNLWYTATTSGYNVTVNYGENHTQSARTTTISAEGIDPDTQETIMAYYAMEQAAGVPRPIITGITISASWATDVPASGGVATYENCNYTVTAYLDNGTTEDITQYADMDLSTTLVVPATSSTTRQNVGTISVIAAYDEYTSTQVVSVYQAANDSPVPPTPPSSGGYLTFNIVSAGTLNWHRFGYAPYIEYSTNSGLTWSTFPTSEIEVSAGDTVMFRGSGTTSGTPITENSYGCFSGTSSYNLSGNIMSLVYGDNYEGQTTLPSALTFRRVFYKSNGLLSAEDLLLPATGLTEGCYNGMFEGCVNLTKAPRVLPATTLPPTCYANMFNTCTALTTTPVISATTLGEYSCSEMFYWCRSLTTAPDLPVTTLEPYCYYQMFNGCTSLTTAPDLPAATLEPYCYYRMFYSCSNLSYIKCLATDISANKCTYDWVSGVASAGTFVKTSGMTDWEVDSPDGIPVGWTVIDDGQTYTWQAYNRSEWNVYGNLHSGSTQDYAGLEVHSGETEDHNEAVPVTLTSAYLALSPAPQNPANYSIVLSNSTYGDSMVCAFDSVNNAWVGTGSVILEQGTILDIAVVQL